MEPLYLLLSIISTFLTSLVHSLVLFFRRRAFFAPQSERGGVTFYQGTVWHERRLPVHHSFRYSIRYALYDLDLDHHAPPDHLSPDEARRVAKTTGPVFLLTIPPSVGYEQNPLSLYYCYDGDDHSASNLTKCIAEVTNTPWGERVVFVIDPTSDLVAKPLHVSPFMDMMGNWRIKASAPGDSLWVSISVQHPEHGDNFVATLNAKRTSVSDSDTFFWLMPHKVAVWIYWQALQLWWKNLEFIQHPRYSKPEYREEAVIRDQKLQCGGQAIGCLQSRRRDPPPVSAAAADRTTGRWLKWRDAKWPWC